MKNALFPKTTKPVRSLRMRSIAKLAVSWVSITTLSAVVALQPLTSIPAEAQSNGHIRLTSENATTLKQIRLGLNKSIVVDLPADAHDILVANPEVADAVSRTSRRIYLFGKEIGQTNIFVFDGSGNQVAAIDITIERDISGLEETISRLVPHSDVKAEMINDNIVLTGTVSTPQAAAKAVSLAQIFVSGGEQTDGGADTLLELFGGGSESQIVNLLKIQGEDQVHLKVTIAEVQREVIKQLGISTGFENNVADGFGFETLKRGFFQQNVVGTNGGSLELLHGLNRVRAQLQALESAGVMRTLAEPSLTAISGEEAHFNVGGRYQAPQTISTGDGAQLPSPPVSPTPTFPTPAPSLSAQFQEVDYGISLSFRPVVLTEGRISLKINTEVKEPTAAGGSLILGRGNLLGIRHRQADTTVELPSGGSMVIAGLVQDDVRQVVSGYPGLKNIPVLGSLFRSREFQRKESEVIIIVTPYLVRPTARKNLALPDENFQPATDAAGYFMGRVNRVYGTKQGNLPKGRYTGSIGFILK